MPKVVITFEPKEQVRQAVADSLTAEAEVAFLVDAPRAERAGLIQSADVLVFFMLGKDLSPEEMPLISRIPLLQSIPAGVEHLPFKYIGKDSILCANAGAWAWPLAEYVMAMIMFLDRDIAGLYQKTGQRLLEPVQCAGP